MLRIGITCGHGFASGFLSKRLQDLAKREHLEDKVTFVKIPYYELIRRQNEVDIAMLMPHVEHYALADNDKFSIPLYIIPFKVVAGVKARAFLEDAEDILAVANGKCGICRFPDEENIEQVHRLVSHRVFAHA
ncbi:MAG: hypothetical protein HUJ57_05165 [Erysipelotrichaceae bacterium]|nr:hypothetical protein [Erysipelotrichaceae bacterium]